MKNITKRKKENRLIKKRILIIILLLFTAFGFSQEIADKILAIVNNEIITLHDYQTRAEELYKFLSQRLRGEKLLKAYTKQKNQLLDMMIEEKLLISKAKELDINADADIDLYIENIKKQNKIESDEQLKKILSKEGIKFEEWKKNLKKQIIQQKVIQKAMGDKIKIENTALMDYYNKHKEEFRKEAEYNLMAIYLMESDYVGEEIKDIKNKIDKELQKKEFSKIAEEFSSEPLKSKKGNLGIFKKGELDKVILNSVEKLKKGEMSKWIQYKEGWIKVKLKDLKESKILPFKEVQDKIYEKLYKIKREKFLKQYVKKLKKEGYIKIYNKKQ
jgi:peptidyl-prolyl cis-trans isomerase SurA